MTGKVISATYHDFSFKVGGDNGPEKTLYRHDIEIECEDGIHKGVYDSVSIEQKTFVVGQEVKFTEESKTSKRGNIYLKFKIIKENPFSGGKREYNDPKVNAQIERMTSLQACIELGHYYTIPEIGKMAREISLFMRQYAEENGNSKQISIAIQSATKASIQYHIKILNPTNMNLLVKEEAEIPVIPFTVESIKERAIQFTNFIING